MNNQNIKGMNKEQLNLEPFYYVEPMRIIDNDPDATFEFFYKYDKEKEKIKDFLKQSSLDDFLWVIISVFKDEFGDGALLSSFISETVSKEDVSNGLIINKKPLHRNDIKSLKFKYTDEDYFDWLEFEITNPLVNIDTIIEEVLAEKEFTKNGNTYTLESNSGIDYINVTPTFFKLKANEAKAKRFH